WDRVFVIYDAIAMGIPLSRIHEITKIDMWFLKQYEELYLLEKEISKYTIDTLPKELLLEAKQKGYGDRQIAQDRKSTRLNSSHVKISYAVFCLKKKKK